MNYPCTFDKCCRKFEKKEELTDHISRRHSSSYKEEMKRSESSLLAKLATDNILNLKTKSFAKRPTLPLKNKKECNEEKDVITEKIDEIKEKNDKSDSIKNGKPIAREEKNLNNGNLNENIDIDNSFNSNAKRLNSAQKSEDNKSSVENTTIYSMNFKDNADIMNEFSQPKDFEEMLAFSDNEYEKEEIGMASNLQDILESRKKLTECFILEKAGGVFEKLEHINMLVLRNESLHIFETNDNLKIDRLITLEYLCLSHNNLFNLYGVGQCNNLIELNINFNKVEDLYPLKSCVNLEKLWASNNKIAEVKILSELKHLRVLSLYKNRIKNIDDIITTCSQLKKLEELDLGGNPATKKFVYKYDLLYTLRLKKLDGETITEIDYELAKTFKQEQLLKTRNLDDPNLQRPSTAPGKIRNNVGVDLNSNYSQRFKDKLNVLKKEAYSKLNDIPEGAEKYFEMEQEFEVIKEERTKLRKEIQELKNKESEHVLKIKQLENDLLIKNVESNSAYILMDENQELKQKISVYENLFKDETKPESVFLKQISLLHLKINELLNENTELKKSKGIIKQESIAKLTSKTSNKVIGFSPPIEKKSVKIRANTKLKRKSMGTSELEKALENNSKSIDQLKEDLRNMVELYKENGVVDDHEDSFGDNNIFDPEI